MQVHATMTLCSDCCVTIDELGAASLHVNSTSIQRCLNVTDNKPPQSDVARTSQLQVDSKYLRPIPLNTPTRIQVNGIDVMITMLDANHCPGAAMVIYPYIEV
jgi:Cft2 family RNA processing exonuclease